MTRGPSVSGVLEKTYFAMYAEMSYDESEDKAQDHHGRANVHDNLGRDEKKS